MRAIVLATAILMLTVPPVPAEGTPQACPAPDPALPGAPAGMPAATAPTVVAQHGHGVIVSPFVEEVFPDGEGRTSHATTPLDGAGVFVYAHYWPTTPTVALYGVSTPYTRTPLFALEYHAPVHVDPPQEESFATPLVGATASSITRLTWDVLLNEPSEPYVAEDSTLFVWHSIHRVAGETVWVGWARTDRVIGAAPTGSPHEADAAYCVRMQIDPVVRTAATGTTRVGAGLYLVDRVDLHHRSDGEGTLDHAESHAFQVGVRAGGEDVPLAAGRVDGAQRGTSETPPGGELAASVGLVTAGGGYLPLVGADLKVTRDHPPNAYASMARLGAFVDGEFTPVLGARSHYEKHHPVDWAVGWSVGGGNGAPMLGGDVGDWEHDVGAFGADGNFVPILGAAYDDTLAEAGTSTATGISARWPAQSLLTVGPWVDGEYAPALGVTYDGERPYHESSAHYSDTMDRAPSNWLVSTGVFVPSIGYVPLAGAETLATGEPGDVHEQTTVGTFLGAYPNYVPLGGVRAHSAYGWWDYRADSAAPPVGPRAPHTFDAGAFTPNGQWVPLAGVHHEAYADDHRWGAIGIWAGGTFVPLVDYCEGFQYDHDATRTTGVGVSPTGERVALATVHQPYHSPVPTVHPLEGC